MNHQEMLYAYANIVANYYAGFGQHRIATLIRFYPESVNGLILTHSYADQSFV